MFSGVYSNQPVYPCVRASVYKPRLVVNMSDSWPGGCEFKIRLRRNVFPAYFRLSPLLKHVRKVVDGLWKEICVSTGVRKPGNTCVSPTAMV